MFYTFWLIQFCPDSIKKGQNFSLPCCSIFPICGFEIKVFHLNIQNILKTVGNIEIRVWKSGEL